MFNVSATLNVARLAYNPSLCLPHLTVKSFDQLSFPLRIPNEDALVIKGLVLDKDNCFAKDHDDKVWPTYKDNWDKLLDSYPKQNILIVSNSAGTEDDQGHLQAKILETNTGVSVLRHSTKKPGCHAEIAEYFSQIGIQPNEIAIIGDRLFTDILMSNMMGSWGVWLCDGVEQSQKIFPKLEREFYNRLVTNRMDNPFKPPRPN